MKIDENIKKQEKYIEKIEELNKKKNRNKVQYCGNKTKHRRN